MFRNQIVTITDIASRPDLSRCIEINKKTRLSFLQIQWEQHLETNVVPHVVDAVPTGEWECVGILQAVEVRLVGGVQQVSAREADGTEFATITKMNVCANGEIHERVSRCRRLRVVGSHYMVLTEVSVCFYFSKQTSCNLCLQRNVIVQSG